MGTSKAKKAKTTKTPVQDGAVKKRNHVRLEPDGMLVCLHCGDRYQVGASASVTMWTAMLDAWKKDHDDCQPSAEATKREQQERWDAQLEAWIAGNDRGISSETLWSFFADREVTWSRQTGAPHDPADFGRCHRLLQAFPQWRLRLSDFLGSTAAQRHPEWKPFIEHWSELEALFREEVPDGVSGKAPRLFARMKDLRGE